MTKIEYCADRIKVPKTGELYPTKGFYHRWNVGIIPATEEELKYQVFMDIMSSKDAPLPQVVSNDTAIDLDPPFLEVEGYTPDREAIRGFLVRVLEDIE